MDVMIRIFLLLRVVSSYEVSTAVARMLPFALVCVQWLCATRLLVGQRGSRARRGCGGMLWRQSGSSFPAVAVAGLLHECRAGEQEDAQCSFRSKYEKNSASDQCPAAKLSALEEFDSEWMGYLSGVVPV